MMDKRERAELGELKRAVVCARSASASSASQGLVVARFCCALWCLLAMAACGSEDAPAGMQVPAVDSTSAMPTTQVPTDTAASSGAVPQMPAAPAVASPTTPAAAPTGGGMAPISIPTAPGSAGDGIAEMPGDGVVVADAGMGDGGATSTPATPMARPVANELGLKTTMENTGDAPYFNIWRPEDMDAAMAATGGPLPVIVWANGGCFRSDFTWEILFRRWASGGFVVLTLTEHPMLGALAQSTAADHGALVTWAIEQATKGGSPYADKLDTDRIVAAGNSCGGVTALEMTSQNEEVAGVFVLSGSSAIGSVSQAVMGNIHVPVGYVVGEKGVDIAEGAATGDYEALNEGLPGLLIRRSEGDHVTVSTEEPILKEEARLSLSWMDLMLYGTQGAYDELMSETVCVDCKSGDWALESKHLETLLK